MEKLFHRPPVNSPHTGQWRGALMFPLTCDRINGWVNNGKAGDLRRHRAHYDVIVMEIILLQPLLPRFVGSIFGHTITSRNQQSLSGELLLVENYAQNCQLINSERKIEHCDISRSKEIAQTFLGSYNPVTSMICQVIEDYEKKWWLKHGTWFPIYVGPFFTPNFSIHKNPNMTGFVSNFPSISQFHED